MRTDEFMGLKLAKAIEERERRAKQLLELDEAVNAAVKMLKERGFDSPYLKSFVVARTNFLRVQKGEVDCLCVQKGEVDCLRFQKGEVDFDAAIERMIAAAKRFDAAKIKTDDVARSGGVLEE
ncbi:MAG: hypothetical protein IPJ19_17810 [Planctomycetes bacterium]|nr:hypothetical protein [Planctomycetota bacterium]